MQFAFYDISEVAVILISHFGKSKSLFSVKLCCFACPVGFVIKKSKDKTLQFFRVHQVKQISPLNE